MNLRRGLLALLLGFVGCAPVGVDGPYPIEGSTWQLGTPEANSKGDVKIDVLTDRSDCINAPEVDEADLDACVPRVDRGTGQVHLSFRLIDQSTKNTLFIPLNQAGLDLAHLGSPRPASDWELVPHGPMRAGQLFVIIIDGSASIYTTGGIKKVKRALLTPEVIESFLPEREGETTGVMLLRFSEGVTTIDGKDPLDPAVLKGAILEKRSTYTEMVEKNVERQEKAGYSHLYNAVSFASGKLLEQPHVRNWLQTNHAAPTIVVLTDGFNNENPRDTCSTNVPRLNAAMEIVAKSRREGGIYKPTVYTVGLGRAMQPKFKLPAGGEVTALELCKSYPDERIDGHLENIGIDNPSLMYLSDAGGGESFVRNNHRGLADVFLKAAAQRYKWYTARYQVDRYYLRRSFDLRMRLTAYAQAETTVWFHPSAWLDAPSGRIPEGARWAVPSSVRHAFVPLMGILGALTFLLYLGPAVFNARRALFRRARRK